MDFAPIFFRSSLNSHYDSYAFAVPGWQCSFIMRCSCLKRDALFIPYQSTASKKHSSILASLGLGSTTGEESERLRGCLVWRLRRHTAPKLRRPIRPPHPRRAICGAVWRRRSQTKHALILNKHKMHLIPDKICPPDPRIGRESRRFLAGFLRATALNCNAKL